MSICILRVGISIKTEIFERSHAISWFFKLPSSTREINTRVYFVWRWARENRIDLRIALENGAVEATAPSCLWNSTGFHALFSRSRENNTFCRYSTGNSGSSGCANTGKMFSLFDLPRNKVFLFQINFQFFSSIELLYFHVTLQRMVFFFLRLENLNLVLQKYWKTNFYHCNGYSTSAFLFSN